MILYMINLIEKYNELRYGTKVSVSILVISNLSAIIGAIFFEWEWMMILLAYWMENGIIGFFTLLKIIINRIKFNEKPDIQIKGVYNFDPTYRPNQPFFNSKPIRIIGLFIEIPFLILHFGGFMLGHLIMIITLFFNEKSGNLQILFETLIDNSSDIISIMLHASILAVILFFSHASSFYMNFINNKEYLYIPKKNLGFSMYGRVMILHTVIIIGALFAEFLNNKVSISAGPAILLVLVKTFTDVIFHLRERKKFSSS